MIEHEYFGPIEVADGFADLPSQTIAGKSVTCELMQDKKAFEAEDLDRFAVFCRSVDTHLGKAQQYIHEHHVDIIGFAYESWFESEPEMMRELFPTANNAGEITPDMTLKRVAPATIYLSNFDDPASVTVDLKFTEFDLDYLLSASFNLDGKLCDVSLES